MFFLTFGKPNLSNVRKSTKAAEALFFTLTLKMESGFYPASLFSRVLDAGAQFSQVVEMVSLNLKVVGVVALFLQVVEAVALFWLVALSRNSAFLKALPQFPCS